MHLIKGCVETAVRLILLSFMLSLNFNLNVVLFCHEFR